MSVVPASFRKEEEEKDVGKNKENINKSEPKQSTSPPPILEEDVKETEDHQQKLPQNEMVKIEEKIVKKEEIEEAKEIKEAKEEKEVSPINQSKDEPGIDYLKEEASSGVKRNDTKSTKLINKSIDKDENLKNNQQNSEISQTSGGLTVLANNYIGGMFDQMIEDYSEIMRNN